MRESAWRFYNKLIERRRVQYYDISHMHRSRNSYPCVRKRQYHCYDFVKLVLLRSPGHLSEAAGARTLLVYVSFSF